jgi:hypothetical protein
MDLRVDIRDLIDDEETDDSAYEPSWYSVLKELASAPAWEEAPQRA